MLHSPGGWRRLQVCLALPHPLVPLGDKQLYPRGVIDWVFRVAQPGNLGIGYLPYADGAEAISD
jgi:hypothetical protein